MKKVLLLGDSIRKGYDKAIKKTLEGKAEVYFPNDNCRFAAYLLRYLHEYGEAIENGKPDVIHWNAGLWDILTMLDGKNLISPEAYAENVERICNIIKMVYPKAKMVFAT